MHRIVRASLITTFTLVVAACGKGDNQENLATLDAELVNNTADPALREAVEGPLATDPDLKGQANRDAVRPSDTPLNGAVPMKLSPKQARAQALKLAGGKLMTAPEPTKTVTSTGGPLTLGGMAEKKQNGKCGAARVEYDMEWANRMPAAFPVYPGGHVTEAAGASNAPCNLRAVSFTTAIPRQEVMDFYYTMARRAGYDAEHIEENGEHVLGGTRDKDEGAYYVSLKPASGGGTAVDLIANLGR